MCAIYIVRYCAVVTRNPERAPTRGVGRRVRADVDRVSRLKNTQGREWFFFSGRWVPYEFRTIRGLREIRVNPRAINVKSMGGSDI